MKFLPLSTVLVLLFLPFFVFAQSDKAAKLVAGPIAGHYTDDVALFWVAYKHKSTPEVAEIEAIIKEKHGRWLGKINAVVIDSIARYKRADFYHVSVRREAAIKDDFNRDISFLAGSCAFQYPTFTGQRKKRNQIFGTMAKTDAEFMIWLGDNVYYLAGEWNSYRRMVKKNIKVRRREPIRTFFETMPNYALWDDHDFGPNNSDSRFKNRHKTTLMFKHTWRNPHYGIDTSNNNGICMHFTKADAEFFCLDTRSFARLDSNTMIGAPQMQWLQEKLLASKANFKFITMGAQVLTDDPMGVHMGKCVQERQALLDFIAQHDIKGVVFLTGDRHFAEVAQWKREGKYTLQEITTSPMTSFIDERGSINSYRKPNTFIPDTNFVRFNLRGQGEARECYIELFDRYGKIWWTHTIKLSELQ